MAQTPDQFNKQIKVLEKSIKELAKTLSFSRGQFDKGKMGLKQFHEQVAHTTKRTKKLKAELKVLTTQQKLHTEQVKKSTSFMLFQQRGTRNLSTSLSVLRSQLLIGAFALGTTQKIIGGLINSFAEYDAAVKRLSNSFQRTGFIANVTTEEIIKLASELQNATGVSDTLTMNAAGLLSTFTKLRGEAFLGATEAAIQMTDAMYFGNVTQENLRTTVIQLGKALNEPIKGLTALRRVGVSFSASQKEQIANFVALGDMMSAQLIILEELNDEFGNTANIETYEKSLAKLTASFGDFRKTIGAAISGPMIKILNFLTDAIKGFGLLDLVVGGFIVHIVLLAKSLKKSVVVFSRFNIILAGVVAALGMAMSAAGAYRKGVEESSLIIDEATKRADAFSKTLEGLSLQNLKTLATSIELRIENAKQALSVLELMDANKDMIELAKERISIAKEELKIVSNRIDTLNKDEDVLRAITKQYDMQSVALKEQIKNNEQYNKVTIGFGGSKRKQQMEDEIKLQKLLAKEAKKYTMDIEKFRNAEGYDEAKKAIMETIQLERERLQLKQAINETDKLGVQLQKELLSGVTTLMKDLYATQINLEQQALDAQTERVNKQFQDQKDLVNSSVASEAVKQKRIQSIQKQQEAFENQQHNKSIDLQIKAALAEGLSAQANIQINGIMAVMKLASQLGAYAGPAMAAMGALTLLQGGLAAAQTGMQVAQLNAQKKQYGADQIVTSPTLFMAGEGAMAERVTVTPTGANTGTSGQININFSGNVLSKDFIEDEAIPMIRDALRRGDTI